MDAGTIRADNQAVDTDRAVTVFLVVVFAALAVTGVVLGWWLLVLPLVIGGVYWLLRSAITEGIRRAN